MTRGWPVLRGTAAMLAAPQGFTLSVAGTLAATVCQRGAVGLLDIWLFVVGGSVGFCLLAVAGGVLRRPGPARALAVPRWAVLNVAPVAVVPVAVGATAWVPGNAVAFLVAGALATSSYVALLVLLLWSTGRTDVPAGSLEAQGP